jgi:hypothetical protein
MNEEMTGKCLRQMEHIRGHFQNLQFPNNVIIIKPNNLHQVRSKSKDWKAKQFKSVGIMKTKEPRQNSHNFLK